MDAIYISQYHMGQYCRQLNQTNGWLTVALEFQIKWFETRGKSDNPSNQPMQLINGLVFCAKYYYKWSLPCAKSQALKGAVWFDEPPHPRTGWTVMGYDHPTILEGCSNPSFYADFMVMRVEEWLGHVTNSSHSSNQTSSLGSELGSDDHVRFHKPNTP